MVEASACKRVLILDDSPLILDIAAAALRKAGYEVVIAKTLSEMDQALAAGGAPDLLLIDVQMPEAFGNDVAMVLRGMRHIEAPIYLFSNLPSQELASRAQEAEIDGFICKRDGIAALVTTVNDIFGAAQ